jgi:large subunit ribosomal protein L25
MERKLKTEPRAQIGKGAARKIRAGGRVPAVVYGRDVDPLHVSIDAKELFHLLHTDAGMNVLVDMKVDSDQFLHVDFLRIKRDEKIGVEVPIHLVGESHGVKEGGVVEHHLWTLHLECFPQDVPTSIEADISALGINESLKVMELEIPDNLTLLTSPDEVIVSVVPPQILRVEEEVAAEAEEEAAAAEAEGAEGAEGEQAPQEGGESEES